jgi:transposase-like protein
MHCVACGSAAVTARPELTAQGYRRFKCQDCGQQFNERSDGILSRASLPSDVIAFVVFCRLRYRLTLRDLSEIILLRGFTVSHESIRRWEAKLLSVMGVAERCVVAAGNFLESVPRGDLLILKAILHDWEDDEAHGILQTCRKAVGGAGKLLVIERVLAKPNEGPEAKFADLNMLVGADGR